MTFEAVIGVEAHAQLRTRTKLFCGCATTFGAPANTHTCPVCLGLPGALPALNARAVAMAIRTGLALGCVVRSVNRFARKNYFYPDLPKGYQISQYDLPICEHGRMDLVVNGNAKQVGIRRAHLEEDAGKTVHAHEGTGSFVDLNRAGTPLLEIVTGPDMHSAEEVVAYLKSLRDVLMYLDVCDGSMEQGSLRCEPNLSLRPAGSDALGTKVEVKNINSFKFVKDAIAYEITRQTDVLASGGVVRQETRLWDSAAGRTVVMRRKEDAHDYRYFPDPDLVPLSISEAWIEELRATIQELPDARRRRFVRDYGVSANDAGVLTGSRALAEYFEACVALCPDPALVAHFLTGVFLRHLHQSGATIESPPVSPERLAEFLTLVRDDVVSLKAAGELFSEFCVTDAPADQFVDDKGMRQMSDGEALRALVEDVIAHHAAQVAQYRGGKHGVLGFLVGRAMQRSGGRANPGKVHELFKTLLS